jgi:hypothetical protein
VASTLPKPFKTIFSNIIPVHDFLDLLAKISTKLDVVHRGDSQTVTSVDTEVRLYGTVYYLWVFVRHVNACQLSRAKANVASSGFLLSRTLMVWGTAATSMQLPPLLVL